LKAKIDGWNFLMGKKNLNKIIKKRL